MEHGNNIYLHKRSVLMSDKHVTPPAIFMLEEKVQELQNQNKLLLEFARKTFECDAKNESLVGMNWVHLVESLTGKQVAKLLEEKEGES